MNKITVDHPGHLDQLGRTAFARHLLSLVQRVDASNGGAVLGLEGNWGSGKTRVLRSLNAILEEQDATTRPILIAFNPWMVSGTPGLVEALLLQIAAEIPSANAKPERSLRWLWRKPIDVSKGASLASAIVQYAGVLGAVKHFAPAANMLLSGSGFVLEGIGYAADAGARALDPLKEPLQRLMRHPASLSIAAARRKIEHQLGELNRRILVVVDDLDRLPPRELAAMVQAIKAVADFSNVVYLVAYDPEVAAEAIETALHVSDGRAFLEKIVQLPVPLPHPPANKVRAFAIDRLSSTVDMTALDDHDKGDLGLAWPLAAAVLKSPREVERLRTRLLVALPVLQGKVNSADVMLLESLTLTVPAVVEWLFENPRVLMSAGIRGYDDDLNATGALGDPFSQIPLNAEQRQRAERERPGEWAKHVPENSGLAVPAREIMSFLFDKARNWDRPKKRSGKWRVQDYRFWYRWQCYHDRHERWEASYLSELLTDPHRIVDDGITRDIDTFTEFCQEVCDLGLGNIDHSESEILARVFVEADDIFGFSTKPLDIFNYGPINALTLALRTDSPERRIRAFRYIIEDASVWLSGHLVHRATAEMADSPAGQRLFSDAGSLRLEVLRWLERAEASLAHRDGLRSDSRYCPNTLLNWMRKFEASPFRLRDIAARFLAGEPENLTFFFAGDADDPAQDAFGVQLNLHILPDARQLMRLIDQLPDFKQSHSRITEAIQSQANRLDAIADLINVLKHVADHIQRRARPA